MATGIVADGCVTAPDAALPAATPTLVDLDDWSSLCSTGHTPNIITGAFLRFLQEHFSSIDKIEDAALRDNLYKQQATDTTQGIVTSGVLIDPLYKWNPQNFGLRPAVYIKRNGMQPQRLGINDGMTVGINRSDATNELLTLEGEEHFVGVVGSHTFFSIGRTGAETEVLASEVYREILQFSPVLRRELKLKKLTVSEVSELNKLEEFDQHFVVAIVVGWYYFERWRLRPIAPWLKSVSITLQSA